MALFSINLWVIITHMMSDYHPRWLTTRIEEALADTPVVLLNGARQTGKSTLAQALGTARNGRYVTLDDPTALAAARSDPVAFADDGAALTVIDEIQKAPDLLPAIKLLVDRQRRPGRYLLTGSADVLTLPEVSESLAGRMEVLSLQPLAQGEIAGQTPDLIAALFANAPPERRLPALPDTAGDPSRVALAARIATGGFPEALARASVSRRAAWFAAYVTTVTQRDVRDLANIADTTALPRILALLAARSGGLVNMAELARGVGLPQATLQRYLALLQATFLYQPLPAWHANLGKRLIKAPKAYLIDSGLACALCGLTPATVTNSALIGPMLESHVLDQLRRTAAAMPQPPGIFHYRSAGGAEVDFIIEDAGGRCIAIEVKATRSLSEKHFAPMKDLQAALGERFHCGVVLYGGEQRVRFGERVWGVGV
jgi:predicted AAA+ superfamily ATPase